VLNLKHGTWNSFNLLGRIEPTSHAKLAGARRMIDDVMWLAPPAGQDFVPDRHRMRDQDGNLPPAVAVDGLVRAEIVFDSSDFNAHRRSSGREV
jgi:hypothetical protein